ncbi:MAG: hypothetical protein JZU55_08515 [Afipia sp.]|nr:hypothetical protein [Afipia sp.]
MTDMTHPQFSVAVFPFLKTHAPIRIGGYTFRSTDDVEGLPPNQARAVDEIKCMLFVQDELRVKTASYAILPHVQLHNADQRLTHLADLRAVVAYLYSAPHEIFETVFLAPEDVSLALLTPERVSVFLTRPEHHTESMTPHHGPAPDKQHNVPGYSGLYNFRHLFCVEPGSRIYGPMPHMVLNISQDLCMDLGQWSGAPPDYRLLLDLLEKPTTPASQRIYAAIHWYNAANEHGLDHSHSLLNLAIAFETLLRLPESSKKERLIDAISLLLGRVERLSDWADQFYAARSRVAHEGQVNHSHYYAPFSGKQKHAHDIFGSLMLYGRQVFQLCVSTLLVGIDLAERADLQEKFVTNNERYQKICDLLKSKTGTPSERLLAVQPTLQALERYRFVANTVSPGPAVTAVRLAALAIAACGQDLWQELTEAVTACANSKRQDGEMQELETIARLYDVFERSALPSLSPETRILRDIVHHVWMNLFSRYYWLKDQQREN